MNILDARKAAGPKGKARSESLNFVVDFETNEAYGLWYLKKILDATDWEVVREPLELWVHKAPVSTLWLLCGIPGVPGDQDMLCQHGYDRRLMREATK